MRCGTGSKSGILFAKNEVKVQTAQHFYPTKQPKCCTVCKKLPQSADSTTLLPHEAAKANIKKGLGPDFDITSSILMMIKAPGATSGMGPKTSNTSPRF